MRGTKLLQLFTPGDLHFLYTCGSLNLDAKRCNASKEFLPSTFFDNLDWGNVFFLTSIDR